MRPGLSRVASENAVAAVVTAKIGQRQEDLPRIGDDAGFEIISRGACGGEQRRQIVVTAADQAQRGYARDGSPRANGPERRDACRTPIWRCRRGYGPVHEIHSVA